MNKDNKQRNVIITVGLGLSVLINLAITVGFIILMYDTRANEETLGLGLCSMFTFANVLGSILLLRWSKNGLGLIAVSAILLSIVFSYVLHFWIVETIPFIIAVIFLWLILQIRKGGKSAWSQLKSGWDGKHCRHIYQIFAVVELILFILTIIAFGGKNGNQDNPAPTPVLYDTIVVEKQDPVKDISHDSIPATDTVKKERPVIDSKDQKPSIETPINKKPSENNATPETSSQKTYSLDDAAKYLDTHNVWVESEMNHYPDLHNIRKHIGHSLVTCRNQLPSSLVSKSKRLNEISKLFSEVEHLSIVHNDKRIMSRLRKNYHRFASSDKIEPYQICNLLRETIDKTRSYDRREKSTGGEPSNTTPSNENSAKKRSIGGASPNGKDDTDSIAARKKRIQKEIDIKKR